MNSKITFMAQAGVIAALYVVLTLAFLPVSYGEIQVRFSEALTILPYFTPAAIPGLFIGCFIANMTGGLVWIDVIAGSLTTLMAAILSYSLRKHKFLTPVPPIVLNALVVPFVLRYAYAVPLPIPFMMGTVGLGEVISCGVMGLILLAALDKYKHIIFRTTYKENI